MPPTNIQSAGRRLIEQIRSQRIRSLTEELVSQPLQSIWLETEQAFNGGHIQEPLKKPNYYSVDTTDLENIRHYLIKYCISNVIEKDFTNDKKWYADFVSKIFSADVQLVEKISMDDAMLSLNNISTRRTGTTLSFTEAGDSYNAPLPNIVSKIKQQTSILSITTEINRNNYGSTISIPLRIKYSSDTIKVSEHTNKHLLDNLPAISERYIFTDWNNDAETTEINQNIVQLIALLSSRILFTRAIVYALDLHTKEVDTVIQYIERSNRRVNNQQLGWNLAPILNIWMDFEGNVSILDEIGIDKTKPLKKRLQLLSATIENSRDTMREYIIDQLSKQYKIDIGKPTAKGGSGGGGMIGNSTFLRDYIRSVPDGV